MASATPEQAEAYRQWVTTSPAAQALVQKYRARGYWDPAKFAAGRGGATPQALFEQELEALAREQGVLVPHDWNYNPQTGAVSKESFLQRNPWIYPAAIIGGGLAAGSIGGGAGAGTAGSAGGGGAVPTATAITSAGMKAAMPGSMEDAPASPDGGGFDMPSLIRKLAQAGIPIGTLLGTRALSGGGPDAGQSPISPELQQILAMSMRRMADQEPLFQAVNTQAFEGLPTYAKGGR